MGIKEIEGVPTFYYLDIPAGMLIDEAAKGALVLSMVWNQPVSFLFSGKKIEVNAYFDNITNVVKRYHKELYGTR